MCQVVSRLSDTSYSACYFVFSPVARQSLRFDPGLASRACAGASTAGQDVVPAGCTLSEGLARVEGRCRENDV